MRILRFAVDRPVTVFMAAVAATVFGLVAFGRLDLRLLPEIRYPSLTLQTEYPNTAPLDVENLVTRPLEEAAGVIPGLRKIHSISQAGLSQITLEFNWDTPMEYAALEVREKIDLVTLPEESTPPVLLKYDPALDPVLRVSLYGDAHLVQLRNVAEDLLKKEIEALEGVAAAKISGGLEEEIQVLVDENRLSGLGIPIEDVNSALRQENVNASGGRLRDRDAEYLVRTLSRFEDVPEILDVTIGMRDGRAVRLGEVAEIHRGHEDRTAITHVNGRESVEIAVFKEGSANIVDVAERVRANLEALGESLPEDMKIEVLFDQSIFIAGAVREVRNNAILGGALAVLVLLLFLRDLRSTAVIGLSIPISIIATFLVMYTRGISLNVMSLGGLALGVGMLVDNSIVVLESIHRRRQSGTGGADAKEDVVRGGSEVGAAVIASTLTTVAVFAPIVLVVEGVAGQIFRDQALTVTFSLLVSLVVALTFTPMLVALGRRRAERRQGEEDPFSWRDLVREGRGPHWLRSLGPRILVGGPAATVRGVKRGGGFLARAGRRSSAPVADGFERAYDAAVRLYDSLLGSALRHRGAVVASVLVFGAGAVLLFRSLGAELIPPLAQGEFTLAVELPEGTTLRKTESAVQELARDLKDIEGIALLAANIGVSREGGTSLTRRKENRAELYVKLEETDREIEAAVLERIRRRFAESPEVSMKVRRPSLFTFNTPVEVDIYGYDLDALMKTADLAAAEMTNVRGIRDVRIATVPGSPEVRISFDRDKLNQYGLRLSDVARTVQGKVRGTVATQYRDREKHIDIRVRNTSDQRSTSGAIRDLIVAEREGIPIRLAAVANMEIVPGPNEIHRLGGRRVAIISGNVAGRDLGSVTTEVEARMAGIPLPPYTNLSLGGQNDEMEKSFRSLRTAILLAVFLVYLVMAAQFESLLYPFVIMFTVPLALVGAVFGLKLTGTPLSVIAAIGAIMLAGIVVNNGIVLVDRINQLRRRLDLVEAVRQAGRERFRPILMTTATTVLGLFPMALGIGEGAELRAPLAITVISGLLFATALTLLVVPVAYTLLTPGARRRLAEPAREGRPAPFVGPPAVGAPAAEDA